MNNINYKNEDKSNKEEKEIIEGFDEKGSTIPRAGSSRFAKDNNKALDDYQNGVSPTTQMFCKAATDPALYKTKELKTGTTSQRKRIQFKPDKEAHLSEFSEFNPFFYFFPFINFFLQILEEFLGIFTWLFKHCFKATYDMMVPKNFSGSLGIHPGTKYCFNKLYWRYFLTMLCPPAGVFMSYGMAGWVQIIICCILSLLYYIPGLIYSIILMNRSDVAEAIENANFGSCDGATQGFFISTKDNQVECSRVAGEKCHAGAGKPIPGNSSSSSCCLQPIYVDGKWRRGDGPALNSNGEEISSYEEGELTCKVLEFNYLPNSDKGGVCVYKSTGRPGQ